MAEKQKINELIKKIVEKCNESALYPTICFSLMKLLPEIQEQITQLQNNTNEEELNAIFTQLENLMQIINTFNVDNLTKCETSEQILQPITDVQQIITNIINILQNLNIKLTNRYEISEESLANDIKILYGIIADPNRLEEPQIKQKLKNIEDYLVKLGYPLYSRTSKNKSKHSHHDKKRKSHTSHKTSTDTITVTTSSSKDGIFTDFTDIQVYKVKKTDYTQNMRTLTSTTTYSLYNGTNNLTKEEVTIMVLKKSNNSNELFKRLVNVLTAVHHPNLEEFVGADESQLAVITRRKGEKLSKILKYHVLGKKSSKCSVYLDEGSKTTIAFKIASAMAYLHALEITHRDLSTDSILVDGKMNPRITNFASSRFLPDDITHLSHASKPSGFRAPEFLGNEQYDQKIDVFAFAGILYELLVGREPFFDVDSKLVKGKVESGERPTLPDEISDDLRDLIELCWSQESSKRPSFAEIVDNMLSKKIVFPKERCDEFYESMSISNDDLKECLSLFKDINEMIQKSGVYFFECVRLRSFLLGYHYMLQTSSLAKNSDKIEKGKEIQLGFLRGYLVGLKNTIKFTSFDQWYPISLSIPCTEISRDIHDCMEEIYVAMKELDLPASKYDYVKPDIVNDYREIYTYFYNNKEDGSAAKQLNEIESFFTELGYDLFVTQNEIDENIQSIFKQFKDYKVPREDYEKTERIIGRGTSATVYLGKSLSTDEHVAIKEFESDYVDNCGALHYLRREIIFNISLQNEHLIKFIGFNDDEGESLWLISEFMKFGDLSSVLQRRTNRIDGLQKTSIMFDIACGMEYLHSRRVIHRDLKTCNILIDGGYRAKITDFGFSKVNLSLKMTRGVGTIYFMAPEVIKGNDYGFKADVFSFAAILWEMIEGKFPFQGKSEEYAKEAILNGVGLKFRKTVPEPLKRLIVSCRAVSPDERPSFEEIIDTMIREKIAFPYAAYGGGRYDDDDGGEGEKEYMKEIEEFYRKKAEERAEAKKEAKANESEQA